jgi:hypothetical protein
LPHSPIPISIVTLKNRTSRPWRSFSSIARARWQSRQENQLRRDNSRIKTNKFAVAAYVRLWPTAEMLAGGRGGRLLG